MMTLMGNAFDYVSNIVSKTFGRCARCMRLALAVAVGSWVAFFISLPLFPRDLSDLLLAIALVATTNWLLHITFFTVRQALFSTSRVRSSDSEPASGDIPAIESESRMQSPTSRREALLTFAKSLLAAGVASVSLSLPAMARCGDCGPGYHDCITNFCGTSGQVCCPRGYPYLSHCDCDCYSSPPSNCSSYSNCNYCG